MNEFLKQIKKETNYTLTENGAGAYKSTLNACLDAFGALGGMRKASESDILNLFTKAFNEDPATATKLWFYMRDVRGGQGNRAMFRTIAKWMACHHAQYVTHNLDNFIEYGRGDDLLCLLDTNLKSAVTDYLFEKLRADWNSYRNGESISLLAKWLPSENASSKATRRYARTIISAFTPRGINARTYRKMLTTLRAYLKVVEQKMSANEWGKIDYEQVPAKAAMNYTDAFVKRDGKHYIQYIKDLGAGAAKVNAGSLFPVDIVEKALNVPCNPYDRHDIKNIKDRALCDAMWKALPDYMKDHEETGICVVDVSGSMYGTPIKVALSLGMYCADKCHGPFKGHFITFSRQPELQEIYGEDIVEKLHNMSRAHWDMNTNLEAVFDLILSTAKKAHLKNEELPKKLYIISDMQFDAARGSRSYGFSWERRGAPETFMQTMRRKYEEAGYEMPTIVYWNVSTSKCGMFQDTFEGENCCMVSGYSPSLFKSICEGTTYEEVVTVNERGVRETTLKAKVDPIEVMMTTLHGERYAKVWVG